jgi:hypothetical protein
MTKRLLLIFGLLILSGCATMEPPVPENYSGPTALIKDSVKQHSSEKSDFFVLREIDQATIPNSVASTRIENHGRGFYMAPVVIERLVKAQPGAFTIVARTEYAAPILALTNTVYQVIGKVQFSPESGKVYVVKGELGESYSSVWIEEEQSHQVIGEKTEVKGSAALGFFDK